MRQQKKDLLGLLDVEQCSSSSSSILKVSIVHGGGGGSIKTNKVAIVIKLLFQRHKDRPPRGERG